MNIILTALDDPLVEAWRSYCGDLDGVTIHKGSIIELEPDAVVSPANSFGFMDGGIDKLYSHHFGWKVQERLQKLIVANHHGELLVGTAAIVETDHPRIPYLIAAPTMRVPMILRYSVNPYLAARAALLLVKYGRFDGHIHKGEAISDHVHTVAFPGLGTGVGRIEPEICARQVRTAIEEVVLGNQLFPTSWFDAASKHQKLYTDDVGDLQFE